MADHHLDNPPKVCVGIGVRSTGFQEARTELKKAPWVSTRQRTEWNLIILRNDEQYDEKYARIDITHIHTEITKAAGQMDAQRFTLRRSEAVPRHHLFKEEEVVQMPALVVKLMSL